MESVIIHDDVRTDYKLKEEIGTGVYGVVRRGFHRKSGNEVAIKIINIQKGLTRFRQQQLLEAEISILSRIKHPNCISLEAVYKLNNKMFIVMPLVKGGELFDQLVQKGSFSESEAIFLTRKILEAIEYLHSVGIVHRDLKPQNILCDINDQGGIVQIYLTDFGLSKIMDGQAAMQSLVGTPYYIAPETISGAGYTQAVDLWAVGCIVYNLVSGYYPFVGDTPQQIFAQLSTEKVEFPSDPFDTVSEDAKNLIRSLLTKAENRPTASQALQHPWLNQGVSTDRKIVGLAEKLKALKESMMMHNPPAPASKRQLGPMDLYLVDSPNRAGKFGHWDDVDLPSLYQLGTLRSFRVGEIIQGECNTTTQYGLIVSGEVIIEKVISKDGKKVPLVTVGPKEALGTLGLSPSFQELAPPLQSCATTDVEIQMIPYESLREFLASNDDLAGKFWKRVASEFCVWCSEFPSFVKNVRENSMMALKQEHESFNNEPVLFKALGVKLSVKILDHLGTLLVTTSNIIFQSSFFTMKIVWTIPLDQILQLEVPKNNVYLIKIVFLKDGKNEKTGKIEFRKEKDSLQGIDWIKSLWEQRRLRKSVFQESTNCGSLSSETQSFNEGEQVTKGFENTGALTPEDWKSLLSLSELKFFKKNQIIIKEGQASRQLFFVQNGRCRVEHQRAEDDSVITIGMVNTKEVFGEISFLRKGRASASVIAHDDFVCLSLIPGEQIEQMFANKQGFAGRFFNYISQIISGRLGFMLTDI